MPSLLHEAGRHDSPSPVWVSAQELPVALFTLGQFAVDLFVVFTFCGGTRMLVLEANASPAGVLPVERASPDPSSALHRAAVGGAPCSPSGQPA